MAVPTRVSCQAARVMCAERLRLTPLGASRGRYLTGGLNFGSYSSATVCFVSAVKRQGGLTRGFPSVVKLTVEPLYRLLEIASALF